MAVKARVWSTEGRFPLTLSGYPLEVDLLIENHAVDENQLNATNQRSAA